MFPADTGLSENACVEAACLRHPDRCATVTPDGQRVSFQSLLRTIRAFSIRLRENGVAPGQVIVPMAENPAVFHALMLALLRVGATAAIVPSADMAVRHGLRVDAAITLPDRPSLLARNIALDESWFQAEGADQMGPDGAFILCSSGTTGAPKYYLAAQSMIVNWCRRRAAAYDPGETDTLVTLPLATAYGTRMAYQATLIGGAILRPAASARETLELLHPELPLDIMTTPAVLMEFVQAVEDGTKPPENLRAILLGGSATTRQLARRAEAVLGCPVYNGFGSTEVGGVALARPALSEYHQGLIGTPLDWVEMRIEDGSGRELPDGEAGLLAIRVTPDCRIAQTLIGEHPFDAEGWFRAGDMGCRMQDGTFISTGRKSDLINSSGSKVAPSTYEELVLETVSASAVAAFGIPNALGSEDVAIALVADEKIDLAALKARLVELVGTHLGFHLFQVDSLPVNPTGKVDRAALKQGLIPEVPQN